jgi:hypothetical protein
MNRAGLIRDEVIHPLWLLPFVSKGPWWSLRGHAMKAMRSEGWHPVGVAPRDGTPVVLWLIEDETPPVLPLIVGRWTINPRVRVGYWQIFGEPSRFCSDRQIRGWKPLLRE